MIAAAPLLFGPAQPSLLVGGAAAAYLPYLHGMGPNFRDDSTGIAVASPLCKRVVAVLLAIGWLAVGAGACSNTVIIDNWGPPAGYALVTGSVRTAAGRTVANAEVMLSRCASPLDGYLWSGVTDAQGFYRVRANLPPIGLFPVRADTVQIRCYVFVDRASTANDSIDVHFSTDSRAPAVQTLDITVP